jgi:hypothetical protein
MKKEEVVSLELRRETLLNEQSTFRPKLIENKRILIESEFAEIDLLRRVWSRKQMNQAYSQLENVESGWVPNVCAPPADISGELDALRSTVEEALKGIYPTKDVEDMRATTERLRQAVKNIGILIEKVGFEIEDLYPKIVTAKKELSGMEQKIWREIYETIKKDIQQTVMPKIRRAFVAINGYNPYSLQWGDQRFYYDLFDHGKIRKVGDGYKIDDLLKHREDMRKEFFKS